MAQPSGAATHPGTFIFSNSTIRNAALALQQDNVDIDGNKMILINLIDFMPRSVRHACLTSIARIRVRCKAPCVVYKHFFTPNVL